MDELEKLKAQRDALVDEYKQVVAPLSNKIADVSTKITELLRERGELFYIDYWCYGSLATEEQDTLEEACYFAQALSDSNRGHPERVYGKDVNYENSEWDDFKS